MKLVDNIENKTYKGSRATIKGLLYRTYNKYKTLDLLHGVVFIKDTWYIG